MVEANKMAEMAWSVLERYGLKSKAIESIQLRWRTQVRHYHTLEHLNMLLSLIESRASLYSDREYDLLVLAAVFHDVEYVPWRKDNEEESVKTMRFYLESLQSKATPDLVQHLEDIILATKDHSIQYGDKLTQDFVRLDFYPLVDLDFASMVRYEHQLFKEYQFAPLGTYIEERCKFLDGAALNHMVYEDAAARIWNLADYVRSRTYNIGVYAGSFNPFHFGHLNIVQKAEAIFDKVVIVQGVNPAKELASSTAAHNAESLKSSLHGREFLQYKGLTHNLLKWYGGLEPGGLLGEQPRRKNVRATLIRGLRDGNDLAHEQTQHRYMEELNEGPVPSVLILCDKEFSHISSSSIRQVISIAPGKLRNYVPYDYAQA